MKIIVCLKQVPGITEVKIDPATNTLVRQGIKSIINPFDTYALEEGLRIKERCGGEVNVISMGPPQAEEALREAISLGADSAILLSDRDFAGADTLATAYTLSRAIDKTGAYDLVICGRQSIDGDTGQVGPELAEMLGRPFVPYVSKVEEITDTSLRVRRTVEEGHQVVETLLPAVITVTKEINVPRLPSLRGSMKAKNAVIPVWGSVELGTDNKSTGLDGSATWVVKIFTPQRGGRGEMLQGEPAAQVGALLEKLEESGLIRP